MYRIFGFVATKELPSAPPRLSLPAQKQGGGRRIETKRVLYMEREVETKVKAKRLVGLLIEALSFKKKKRIRNIYRDILLMLSIYKVLY